jgi:hypothetical protein
MQYTMDWIHHCQKLVSGSALMASFAPTFQNTHHVMLQILLAVRVPVSIQVAVAFLLHALLCLMRLV